MLIEILSKEPMKSIAIKKYKKDLAHSEKNMKQQLFN